MTAPNRQNAPIRSAGAAYAIGAYALWGFAPIYWKLVAFAPALELLVPRVFWAALLMLVVLTLTRQLGDLAVAARRWAPALAAALLLASNWGIFIYAVQSDQVVATSLGYYINPLVSIVFGLVLLGERLGGAQSLAVLSAAAGVAWLTFEAGALPWISLCLAGSFALYGLVHKLAPQPPLAGLALEMLLLMPFAVLGFTALALRGDSALASATAPMHGLVALSGVVTASPLLLFHAATRRLPLFAIGMFQYLAPTLALVLAVAVYGEPFSGRQAVGFGGVWLGLAIFTFDSILRARRDRAGAVGGA